MTITLETLAAEANRMLTSKTRGDRRIVVPVDDAPEWFTDLCHHAHGDMMPDDWRYEFIEDALCQLENGEEDARDVDDAYPYTHDRLNWLASRADRSGYVDEAASELGRPDTFDGEIALGMWWEMREVLGLVREKLEERIEELEAEADDQDDDAE